MALFGRDAVVHAQTSGAATSAKPGDLEEVVVYGIRASLRESLETKKNATGVLDALTAEDVGKFPDKNLAEALQRIPGVVINREFGEGERINLRGTPTTLTKTTLNGHALATADWFILDQLNSTRAFNYLMLPADLIGKVKVLKSAQADVEEGGIGGTVDVETRNPLDLQPFTAYAQVQGAYTEMSGKTDPYATGLISWRDRDDRFGFLLAAIYQERHLRRDGFEVLGYGPASATDPTLVPALIGSALFTQDRIRSGGNFVMQIRPTDQSPCRACCRTSAPTTSISTSWLIPGVRSPTAAHLPTQCRTVRGPTSPGASHRSITVPRTSACSTIPSHASPRPPPGT